MRLLSAEKRQSATAEWAGTTDVDGVALRLVTVDDAEFTLGLRLDPARNKHLSHVENDIHAQRSWIKKYKIREGEGHEFYFIIGCDGTPVGTLRIYDFRANSFCWGSWIIIPGTSTRVSLASVYLVYKLCFDVLGIDASHFDVRLDNASVNRFHQRMGAILVSSDELNNYYTISKQAVADYFSRYDWGFDSCR